jgi:membrane-anchored mycosin MYCP
MARRRWSVVIAALATVPALLIAPAPASAAPAGACSSPAKSGSVIKQTPWTQQVLAPQRIWPMTTGTGITVAVLDSGVDGAHRQLTGQVLPGFDFLRNTAGADFDCTSHGTAVASLIAAKHVNGVGFEGLAQGVKILPIRVSEHTDDGSGQAASPDIFAKAIRYAADEGAKVINISLSLDADYPAVAQAVDYAIKTKGCLVIAAVGNHHKASTASPAALGSRAGVPNDPPSYPAAYPGVVGVGAVNEDGSRVDESQIGPYVDLVAPGGNVLAATRVSGHEYWKGTSMAAPIVSAAAALVWSASPGLHNSDVAWRLSVTSDQMPGAVRGPEFGYGMVDPYRAVTEQLPNDDATSPQPIPPVANDPVAQARLSNWQRYERIAVIVGLIVLLVAAVGALLRFAMRRGRARAWRPADPQPAPRPARDPDEEPEDLFFALPRRGSE